VALGLRAWGIGFGLPELYHPDEPAYVLQALAVGRGLPDGLTFANPPLFKYVLLAEYAGDYALERVAGRIRSQQDFVDEFRADPSRLYLIARLTSAIFGAFTALAGLALGAAVAGRRAGVIAGSLTAVAYLLTRDAHFGVNDALVTLLVTLGLVFCVRVLREGSRADYLLAGGLAGLAFAAKYHGIALLLPLGLAHVWRPAAERRASNLGAALIACVVTAVAAFPSLVTETDRVVRDVYLHLYLDAVGGYDGLDPNGGYALYARALVIGLGWPLLAGAAVGLGMGIVARNRPMLVVASLPIGLLAVLGAQQLYFARFLLPALPAIVVTASAALDRVFALHPFVGLAAVVAVGTPSLVDVARLDSLLMREDTRTLARDWIATNLPAGALLAVDSTPLGPPVPAAGPQRVLVADESALFDLTVADYRARGVEYVVVSSFTSEVRAIDATREARRQAFYAALPREASVVGQFRAYAGEREPPFVYDQIYGPFNALDELERPGPTVTVYHLNAGPGTPP
jgi:Dolichyl-phosphate-mannose-protein mannosyltransferase